MMSELILCQLEPSQLESGHLEPMITLHAVQRARWRWNLHGSNRAVNQQILEAFDSSEFAADGHGFRAWYTAGSRALLVDTGGDGTPIIVTVGVVARLRQLQRKSREYRARDGRVTPREERLL